MNGSSSPSKTDREYSLALNDDLIRFLASNVKVTAGRRGGEGVEASLLVRN